MGWSGAGQRGDRGVFSACRVKTISPCKISGYVLLPVGFCRNLSRMPHFLSVGFWREIRQDNGLFGDLGSFGWVSGMPFRLGLGRSYY